MNPPKRRDCTKTERASIELLDRQIREAAKSQGSAEITLRVGSYEGRIVGACKQTKGTRTADAIIYDLSGKPAFYLSLKGARFGYNGYGSVGKREELGPRNNHRDPRFRIWAKWVYAQLSAKNGPRRHQTWDDPDLLGYHLMNLPRDLALQIVYGPEAGEEKSFGIKFVHAVLVGDSVLEKEPDGAFRLGHTEDGSLHVWDDMPEGEDAPVLSAHDCVGRQSDSYEFIDGTSFRGWLGAFPQRAFTRNLVKTKASKGVHWTDVTSAPFPQKL